MSIKTYSELSAITIFIERFRYLQLKGSIGIETFGFDRYLNQALYHSSDWHSLRNQIIIRDDGCDLGCSDRPIAGRIIIHHINPITMDDILARAANVFDPENLVCVSIDTHNAIHYGDESMLFTGITERSPNDTILWR